MKIDNPLSREFLQEFPSEAARILEQVSAEHVAALLHELPIQRSVPVLAAMLSRNAANCLVQMDTEVAAKFLDELPINSASRIYRILPADRQTALAAALPHKTRHKLDHYLIYPAISVGALLDPQVDMLPVNITVADALRRLERLDHPPSNEVYLVDEAHHLVGSVDVGRLLGSRHQLRVAEIMTRKPPTLSVHATTESLLSHPGWLQRRRLPVVERDNTLIGVLHYATMQAAAQETGETTQVDPLARLLSLAGLYWLSVAQIMDMLISVAHPGKEPRP